MVRKIYEAPRSIISLFTIFVNGKPMSINFTPVSRHMYSMTGCGSVFETTDENIQSALESHPSFGRTYRLYNEEKIDDVVVEKKADKVEENKEIKHVSVATPAEAREYLVENFGYAAKGLTRMERIEKAALENNIVFDYE